MPFESLELWDFSSQEDIPSRSRLFNLPPKELSSELRESQISYLIRIARAHCVQPMDLINREVIPLTAMKFEKSCSNFQQKYTKTVNAHTKYASEFARALQSLTQRQDLEFTTFIPWGDVLDPRGTGLLSPHPKWCPECLTEWQALGDEPYFPLLWYVGSVKLCQKHRNTLVDTCPSCARHQPFIPKHAYLDHCSHCGGWLAARSDHTRGVTLPAVTVSRYERFLASAISEMIKEAPVASEFATYHRLRQRLREYVQLIAKGVVTEFERLMGFSKTVIRQWINKDTRPQLNQLLLLCYRLQTTPVVLLRDNLPTDTPLIEKAYSLHDSRPKIHLSANARKKLLGQLQDILDNPNDFPTFKAVCKELGYTNNFLKYWFPELCLAISQKHRDHLARRTAKKKLDALETTNKVVTALLEQHRRINNRLIGRELSKHGISMLNPDTRAAVKKAIKDFQPTS